MPEPVACKLAPADRQRAPLSQPIRPLDAVRAAEGELDENAIARERLAGYKLPRSVEFVEGFPRTPSGKVLKRELRQRYVA